MKKTPPKLSGFTLIEMMLVLVIMSTIVIMIANYTVVKTGQVRRDRTALQMQQILNAGLAYYLNSSQWPGWVSSTSSCPTALAKLQAANYLPANMNPPYVGQTYQVSCDANSGVFYVSVTTEVQSDANILAGMVPLGSNGGTKTVTAQVNIPGQNLNNARSVNFAGVYRNGGCVPVPTCPGSGTTAMIPEIFVAATQVLGTYGTNGTGTTPTVYPITNFTTFAVGPALAASVPDCFDSSTTACPTTTVGTVTATSYWRVCIDVGTQAGDVNNYSGATGAYSWGQWQSIMAVTRCSPSTESPGSTLDVWLP